MNKLQRAVSVFKGHSADDIAKLLQRLGIKGRPATTQRCPLSNFLTATNPGTYIVGRKHIYRRCGPVLEKMPTPRNLCQFVTGFDSARYPELLALPPRATRTRDTRKGDRHKQPRTVYPRRVVVNHPAQEVGR